MNNVGIVFIHGAGQDGFIWEKVTKEFSGPFLTINFPNRDSTRDITENSSLEDYTNSAVHQIEQWGHSKFILVAHSIGACVGLTVVQKFPHNLVGFVAISSVIPISGSSFAKTLPFHQKVLLPVVLNFFGTRPPKKTIEKELCNDLNEEQTAMIVKRFIPESKFLYTDRFNFELPKAKRIYLILSEDRSMPISFQKAMAKNLSAEEIVTIESGHLPMISKPKELAAILKRFVQ